MDYAYVHVVVDRSTKGLLYAEVMSDRYPTLPYRLVSFCAASGEGPDYETARHKAIAAYVENCSELERLVPVIKPVEEYAEAKARAFRLR